MRLHSNNLPQKIAKHVLNIHQNRPNTNTDSEQSGEGVGELDIEKMKRYVAYCKASVCSSISSLFWLT
jgi:DNA replication licensing factor MCM5